MLKFNFREYDVPPDYYRWVAPNGGRIQASDRKVFFSKVEKMYRDNSIPMPDNWRDLAEHQCCLVLPPGWSKHEDGTEAAGINTRLELGDYLRGMEVLASVMLSKAPLVSQEEAEERAAKCAACPANIPVPGCAPCVGISNLILDVKGSNETKADQFLKTCAVCKCSSQANVWVRPEILAKGVTESQLQQMDMMPDCWKSRQIRALNNQ